MARPRLTDAERAQRKQENLEKVLRGKPNPGGRVGSEKLWRGAAEQVFEKITGEKGDFREFHEENTFRTHRTPSDPDLNFFGLTMDASWADIRRAYVVAMKKYHPDTGTEKSEPMSKSANTAYDRLKVRFA